MDMLKPGLVIKFPELPIFCEFAEAVDLVDVDHPDVDTYGYWCKIAGVICQTHYPIACGRRDVIAKTVTHLNSKKHPTIWSQVYFML